MYVLIIMYVYLKKKNIRALSEGRTYCKCW